MSEDSHWKYLPHSIRFYLLESDDAFEKFALQETWTPFQAACLIQGLLPKQLIDGVGRVGVVPGCEITNQVIDNFASRNDRLGAEIIDLTKVILLNHRAKSVNAKQIIEWAVERGLVVPESWFVSLVLRSRVAGGLLARYEALQVENDRLKELLSSASDARGEHYQEKRFAILGFAIQALARKVSQLDEDEIPRLIRSSKVNASSIASHLADFRLALGMPEETESSFGHRNLEDTIRAALVAATKFSTDKNSVTTD